MAHGAFNTNIKARRYAELAARGRFEREAGAVCKHDDVCISTVCPAHEVQAVFTLYRFPREIEGHQEADIKSTASPLIQETPSRDAYEVPWRLLFLEEKEKEFRCF